MQTLLENCPKIGMLYLNAFTTHQKAIINTTTKYRINFLKEINTLKNHISQQIGTGIFDNQNSIHQYLFIFCIKSFFAFLFRDINIKLREHDKYYLNFIIAPTGNSKNFQFGFIEKVILKNDSTIDLFDSNNNIFIQDYFDAYLLQNDESQKYNSPFPSHIKRCIEFFSTSFYFAKKVQSPLRFYHLKHKLLYN